MTPDAELAAARRVAVLHAQRHGPEIQRLAERLQRPRFEEAKVGQLGFGSETSLQCEVLVERRLEIAVPHSLSDTRRVLCAPVTPEQEVEIGGVKVRPEPVDADLRNNSEALVFVEGLTEDAVGGTQQDIAGRTDRKFGEVAQFTLGRAAR